MKKWFCLILVFGFLGCATIDIPSYIKDEYPYEKTYYSDFTKVLHAVTQTLEKSGWKISGTSDPQVYERSRAYQDSEMPQIILFTEIQQRSLFVGTKYMRLNVQLRKNQENATDVEIRYLKVTSILFKNFTSYQNDMFINQLLKRIEDNIE